MDTWDFAQYATGLDRDEQQVSERDLDLSSLSDHEMGEHLLVAELPELAEVHVQTGTGSNGFSRVKRFDEHQIADRLTDLKEFGVRLDGIFYTYGKAGKPRLRDTGEFIQFVLSTADVADIPDLLAAVFPDYSVRSTAVVAVAEKLGMDRGDARRKFLARKMAAKGSVSTIPLTKAPTAWASVPEGGYIPKPEDA